ncbi:MAG: Crp/Fnr family transcriptional regulator [Candidatus Bipolaricaulota bacterium]|nr:Crp/Fnr family transcriptional regulator [Candidatus Bipolaricaulota bacterium]MCS7273949.1 Crp/Fnr family transcriptional regulator [Candidatus Bipolaricaulota bacterium]MDW8111027.1 Crp/Fnr family transcriptional regulator [Candidatus Bipolaricaulota bacterium]MDW8329274.1 Crp/Fnr family transcriptional regulator [Candidatus Bipolaricaulota bacterium]
MEERSAQLFVGLPPEKIEVIRSAAHLLEYPEGSRIYAQGDSAEGLYGLWQGVVKEISLDGRGHLRWLRLLGAGELLGSGEVLCAVPQSHTAIALRRSQLFWLSQEDFRAMAREHAEVALWVARHMAQQLCRLRTALAQRAYTESAVRLTEALRRVAQEFGTVTEHGCLIDLDLSRDEWAALVGIAPETVSRVLHQLAERGVIELQGRRILLKSAVLSG